MENQIRELLSRWMEGVNTKNVDALVAMYAENALLIPTFANQMIQTEDGLRDYFTRLGAREGLEISLREKTVVVQPVVDQMALVGGIYSWRFMVYGELLTFEARFTFALDLLQSAPILHHHSSQIPRTL